MTIHGTKLIGAGIILSLGLTAMADTIFDNTSAYNGNVFSMGNGQQVGNEVTLGTGWVLTNFQFEYYSPNDLAANTSLGVDVRFYLNNGALDPSGYPTPSTLVYDSGWFFNTLGGLYGGAAYDLNYTYSDLYSGALPVSYNMTVGSFLPGDFTYSITFTNQGSDSVYLPLANTTANTNYGTYWLYDNGASTWSLLTNTVPANALVIFQGTSATPEPSVFGLGALGAALCFGVSKLKRKA